MPADLEPWLRQTHTGLPVVPRAVLHALEQAQEDIEIWCCGLSLDELNRHISNIPSVGFQMRHIARSLDRLLTYAEGRPLLPEQIAALAQESEPVSSRAAVFDEFRCAMNLSIMRLMQLKEADLSSERKIGRLEIPVTLGDILIHISEHTQRHVGQAITTAKLVGFYRSETSRDLK